MVQVTWFLLALLTVGGGYLLSRQVLRIARHPSGGELLGLLVVAGVSGFAFFLRFRVVPLHHGMYVDEPWYEEAARNFLDGRGLVTCEATPGGEVCAPYVKAAGWPAVLALAFTVRGISEQTALSTSALLGAFVVPLAAVLTRAAGGSWAQSLLAATILAVHPVHVLWSATAETNAAGVTFLLCGLTGALLFLQAPSIASGALAGGGLGAAAAVRPELWLAFAPVLLWVALQVRREGRPALGGALVVVGAVLGALPGIASRHAFSVHSKGELFRWENLVENTRAWFFGSAGPLTVGLTIGALVGAGVSWRRGRREVALVLGGTALSVALFVLSYYPPAGFYDRTMLGAVAPAAVLAAMALPGATGGSVLAGFLAMALLTSGWRSRGRYAEVPETQLLETALPEVAHEVNWPKDALILAEWPTVLRATTTLPVMATSSALDNHLDELISRRPVFLTCDMFCEAGFAGGDPTSACRRVLDNYSVELVRTIGGPHRDYGFFRIVGRTPRGTKPLPCPMRP